MINPEIKKHLYIIKNTLNCVSVNGESNLSYLLGAIRELTNTIALVDEAEKPKEEETV